MGKFDGVLICSDIDGTFRSSIDSEETENKEAVKYFISEGGIFTFATGRLTASLEECGYDKIINAPACLCNGAVIYDYNERKIVRECALSFNMGHFFKFLKKRKIENAFIYYCEESSEGMISVSKEELAEPSEELCAIIPLKVMCEFEDPEDADSFKTAALEEKEFFTNTYISKSWLKGVEFNAEDGTKGAALLFLKEYFGAHTAIGVGDFENDYTLISEADIGVAVENAVVEVKDIADIIVNSCKESAVAHLIETLKNYIKGE